MRFTQEKEAEVVSLLRDVAFGQGTPLDRINQANDLLRWYNDPRNHKENYISLHKNADGYYVVEFYQDEGIYTCRVQKPLEKIKDYTEANKAATMYARNKNMKYIDITGNVHHMP